MLRRHSLALVLICLTMIGPLGCTQPTAPVTPSEPIPPQEAALPNPVEASPTITDVSFLDAETGWLLIDADSPHNSTLAFTRDGGQSWTYLEPMAFQPERLAFTSPTHGWAMGRSDGCQSPTRGQCALTVASTMDGGHSWTEQWTTPTTSAATEQTSSLLAFHNEKDGYLLFGATPDQSGLLLTTGDGGATWREVALPSPYLLDTAIFLDAQQGWVLGHRCLEGQQCTYTIFHTVDGGHTWQSQMALESPLRFGSGSLSFADPTLGWALLGPDPAQCAMHGCTVPLYRTDDGGQTWAMVNWTGSTRPGQEGGGTPTELRFTTPKDGWMVTQGGAASQAGIGVTHDGGRYWSRSLPEADTHLIRRLDVIDVSRAFVLTTGLHSEGSALYRTTDGGMTWEHVELPYPPVR